MAQMLDLRRIVLLATLGLSVACGEKAARGADSTTASATTTPATTAAAGTPRAFGGDTLSDSALIALADRGRLAGKEPSDIWLIVISDFQCPYCKIWHDSTAKLVKRDYVDGGRVRMAYLHLPLPQHPHARAEAEASLCAGVQQKFWEYSDGLFHEQAAIAKLATIEPKLDSLARANKLDMNAFAHCRQSKAIQTLVASDIRQAQQANVRSTPTFLIGDFLVEGVSKYADFRKAIDTALVVARAKGKGTTGPGTN